MEELIEKIAGIQVFGGEIVVYFDLRDAEEPWESGGRAGQLRGCHGAYDEERRRGPGNTFHPRKILVSVLELLPTSGTASGVLRRLLPDGAISF